MTRQTCGVTSFLLRVERKETHRTESREEPHRQDKPIKVEKGATFERTLWVECILALKVGSGVSISSFQAIYCERTPLCTSSSFLPRA